MTPDSVISLLNIYWKCDNVKDEDGKPIGGHVPSFKLIDDEEYADVRVKFDGTYVPHVVYNQQKSN